MRAAAGTTSPAAAGRDCRHRRALMHDDDDTESWDLGGQRQTAVRAAKGTFNNPQ